MDVGLIIFIVVLVLLVVKAIVGVDKYKKK